MIRDLKAQAWSILLRLCPTRQLQVALCGRPGVDARFLGPDETFTITARGACWLTVNQD